MFENLFLFCKGYLILELWGNSKERFLNLCKARKFEIIDIVDVNGTLFCKINYKDYFKIKPFVRKTGCLPKIKKKTGVPFLLQKFKKRKGGLAGILIGIFLLYQCTQHIWYIDVQGGFLHTRQQIVQVLKNEMQVYGGVGREKVDCTELEKKLRLLYNEIGWVSVEKKGCNLYIKLNESTMPIQVEKPETPSHIIAEKDGVIRSVEVVSGIAMVKNGDNVKAGDILISGIVPVVGDYDEILAQKPVGAQGKVCIETDFSYQVSYPMEYKEKIETERKKGVGFFWLQKKLFSYIPRYSDGKYDIITFDMVPFVFRDYELPFFIRTYEVSNYVLMKKRMTKDEAEQKAETKYRMFLSDWEAQGAEIVEEHFFAETDQRFCSAKAEGIVRGNFISYQSIKEEEWQTEYEYRGDNP